MCVCLHPDLLLLEPSSGVSYSCHT